MARDGSQGWRLSQHLDGLRLLGSMAERWGCVQPLPGNGAGMERRAFRGKLSRESLDIRHNLFLYAFNMSEKGKHWTYCEAGGLVERAERRANAGGSLVFMGANNKRRKALAMSGKRSNAKQVLFSWVKRSISKDVNPFFQSTRPVAGLKSRESHP